MSKKKKKKVIRNIYRVCLLNDFGKGKKIQLFHFFQHSLTFNITSITFYYSSNKKITTKQNILFFYTKHSYFCAHHVAFWPRQESFKARAAFPFFPLFLLLHLTIVVLHHLLYFSHLEGLFFLCSCVLMQYCYQKKKKTFLLF
jgi:hypothetical protein